MTVRADKWHPATASYCCHWCRCCFLTGETILKYGSWLPLVRKKYLLTQPITLMNIYVFVDSSNTNRKISPWISVGLRFEGRNSLLCCSQIVFVPGPFVDLGVRYTFCIKEIFWKINALVMVSITIFYLSFNPLLIVLSPSLFHIRISSNDDDNDNRCSQHCYNGQR